MCNAVADTRYLLGRDVQRDCPEIHLLVSLDTGQYKKETCRMDGAVEERDKGVSTVTRQTYRRRC